MSNKVIMANELISGDVVFLANDARQWTRFLNDAWVSDAEQQQEAMLAEASQSHLIIGAELINAEVTDQGELRLPDFREQLRSQGPSVRTDLGKQAIQKAA